MEGGAFCISLFSVGIYCLKQNFKLKGYDIQNEVKKIEDRWLKDEKTIY